MIGNITKHCRVDSNQFHHESVMREESGCVLNRARVKDLLKIGRRVIGQVFGGDCLEIPQKQRPEKIAIWWEDSSTIVELLLTSARMSSRTLHFWANSIQNQRPFVCSASFHRPSCRARALRTVCSVAIISIWCHRLWPQPIRRWARTTLMVRIGGSHDAARKGSSQRACRRSKTTQMVGCTISS